MSISKELHLIFAESRLQEYQRLEAACEAAEIMQFAAGMPVTELQVALTNVARAHVRLAKVQIAIRKHQSGSVEP